MFNNPGQYIQSSWYKQHSLLAVLLWPLSVLFAGAVKLRQFWYGKGFKKSYRLPVPVIVVGNITVGGTGKTPLVIYLARLLQTKGFKPGIICRGYGGKAKQWPQKVSAESDPFLVGDEPVVIARQSGCPVMAGPDRIATGSLLLDQAGCDVLISDDGLQHYALQRNVEMAVIDGERRLGNNHFLPAGPLRESPSRLRSVDFIVVNGNKSNAGEFSMTMTGIEAINLKTHAIKPLAEFVGVDCHAVAGIGNPDRFFLKLEQAGLSFEPHVFPDHYPFTEQDIDFADNKPVLMTEKDAVKCTRFAGLQHWYVPVTAEVDNDFAGKLLHLLKGKLC